MLHLIAAVAGVVYVRAPTVTGSALHRRHRRRRRGHVPSVPAAQARHRTWPPPCHQECPTRQRRLSRRLSRRAFLSSHRRRRHRRHHRRHLGACGHPAAVALAAPPREQCTAPRQPRSAGCTTPARGRTRRRALHRCGEGAFTQRPAARCDQVSGADTGKTPMPSPASCARHLAAAARPLARARGSCRVAAVYSELPPDHSTDTRTGRCCEPGSERDCLSTVPWRASKPSHPLDSSVNSIVDARHCILRP